MVASCVAPVVTDIVDADEGMVNTPVKNVEDSNTPVKKSASNLAEAKENFKDVSK